MYALYCCSVCTRHASKLSTSLHAYHGDLGAILCIYHRESDFIKLCGTCIWVCGPEEACDDDKSKQEADAVLHCTALLP